MRMALDGAIPTPPIRQVRFDLNAFHQGPAAYNATLKGALHGH